MSPSQCSLFKTEWTKPVSTPLNSYILLGLETDEKICHLKILIHIYCLFYLEKHFLSFNVF